MEIRGDLSVGQYLAMQPKYDPDRYTILTGAPFKSYGRLPRDLTPLEQSNATPTRSRGSDQSFLCIGFGPGAYCFRDCAPMDTSALCVVLWG